MKTMKPSMTAAVILLSVSMSLQSAESTQITNASSVDSVMEHDIESPTLIPAPVYEENFLISDTGSYTSYRTIQALQEKSPVLNGEPTTAFSRGSDVYVLNKNNLDTANVNEESEVVIPTEDDAEILMKMGLPLASKNTASGSVKRVIGRDMRQRLYTIKYPARATVLIKTETSSGVTKRCSGAMISKNTVLTAGHCVSRAGTWRTNVRVFPGQDDNASPYGMCTAKRLITNSRWFHHNDSNYDYALIKLNCNVGYSTGWYGLSTTNPYGFPSVIQGYPSKISLRGEQYLSADKVRHLNSRKMFYQNDTTGGMSGSPVWTEISSNGPYIVGVHTAGSSSYNIGVRINHSVLNIIRYAINHFN